MAIAIEDLGTKERVLTWLEGLMSFELGPVLSVFAFLLVLYNFRSIVLGFAIFSLKFTVAMGLLVFILQFFPSVDELKEMPLIASFTGK